MTTPPLLFQPPNLSMRYNWWFHESPVLLVSSWKGQDPQTNKIQDPIQLELDCLLRTEQLLTAHDALRKPANLPAPVLTTEQILADQLAAFIIHQAHVSDPAADSRNLVRLETDLFLLRTRQYPDKIQLFPLFGKKCVPMQHALQRAGAWDDNLSQPSGEITDAMEAVMRLSPGHYKNQKKEHWWQHFFATTFQNATPLLATRKVLLKSGIAYFHANDMQTLLRHLCATSLQRYMAQMQHLLVDHHNPQFAHIVRISDQILSRFSRARDASFGCLVVHNSLAPALQQDLRIDTIYDTMLRHAPLCVRELLFKLKRDGLKNDERCVLRTFLQTCGVEHHVTTDLFMQLSTLDHKSFTLKYGKDIIGLYKKPLSNCYGCPKIQTMGLCPFQDKKRVRDLVKIKTPLSGKILDIEECFKPKTSSMSCAAPSEACTAYYAMCHVGHNTNVTVYNPRSYFLDSHAQRQAKRARIEPPPSGIRLPSTAERKARIERVSRGQLPDMK